MKLNKEQKKLVDFTKNKIEELHSVIDLAYLQLVEDLGDDLSADNENWLFDYIMNPTFNPELAEDHLFEQEPIHSPEVGEIYQHVKIGTHSFEDIYIVCSQKFCLVGESYFSLQNVKNGIFWTFLTKNIEDIFGKSADKFIKLDL